MELYGLCVLGPFEVRRGDTTLAGFHFVKERVLLAYLAMESDRPHAREALVELFWPGRPAGVGRNNLRQALFRLRRWLGDQDVTPPLLCLNGDSVQLCDAGAYRLDAAVFKAQAHTVQSHRHLSVKTCPDCLERLRTAAGLYRGEFLEGLCLSDCPEAQNWIEAERVQLHHMLFGVLQQLVEALPAHEAYDYARRLVQDDPLDEKVCRELMLILARQDRRGEALNRYQALRQALNAELGLVPSEETDALYRRIQAGRVLPEPQAPPAATIPAAAPFVARERELAALQGHLTAALAGEGRVVFITGDAGSGKTRLAGEFAQRAVAARADLLIACGNCSAQAGIGDPYLPFVEVLQALAGDPDGAAAGLAAGGFASGAGPEGARRLWDAFPVVAQALLAHGPGLIGHFKQAEAWAARLNPPLQSRLKEITQAASRMSPLEQTALFGQFTGVLHAIARVHPLLLVLEDLHWGDAGSLNLLFHLGRRLTGQRILVIGTYRSHEVASPSQGARHPLQPVVHELERMQGEIRVDLDAAGGREFVDALLDTPGYVVSAGFRDTLFRYTGGHALFTVELLRGMQERGDLRLDGGRWREGATLNWQKIPTRVEAVIAEQLARLPDQWRATLAIAAVEGEQFTAEVVARVQETGEREIQDRLNAGLERRYGCVSAEGLQRNGAGKALSRYRFRHSLFQRYLYTQLNAVERARLHEAVGRAIEALYAEQAHNEAALLLAWHFEAAGKADEAAMYLLHAGQRAMRLSASEDAIALLERGIRLLEGLPASAARQRLELELLLALAAPLLQIRGWGAAERATVFARARHLAQQLGGNARLFATLLLQSNQLRSRGRLRESLEVSLRFLEMARAAEEPVWMALAGWSAGETHLLLGELTQARADLSRFVAAYDPRAYARVRETMGLDCGVLAHAWLASVCLALGDMHAATRHGDDAISLARSLEHPLSLAFALLMGKLLVQFLCGEYRAAQAVLAELQALAEEKGLADFRTWAAFLRGCLQAVQGEPDAGIAAMEAADAQWQAAGSRAGRPLQMLLLADACVRAGQAGQALAYADEGLAVAAEDEIRICEADLWRVRAACLAAQGADAGAVEECLLRAVSVAEAQQARFWQLRALLALQPLWQARGRAAEARTRLAETCAWLSADADLPELQAARAWLSAERTPTSSE